MTTAIPGTATPAPIATATPTTLSAYYGGNLVTPTQTVAQRFALPGFADAAKAAGYDANSYAINQGNADANNKILAHLIAGSTAVTTPAGTTPATVPGGVPSSTGTPTTPTIGSLYQLPGTQPNTNTDESAANAAALAFATNLSNGTPNVNSDAEYQNALKQFQAEIDSTNAVYADKLTSAKQANSVRLGSNTAVQARRGLAGSDFGNAETDNINTDEGHMESEIENERQQAINAIQDKARGVAAQAVQDKTAAMSQGLDARVKYYQDADTKKATSATSAANYIYQQGIDPKDLTPDQLQQTAAAYGVSPADITSAYASVKQSGDAAKTKAAKDNEVSVGNGDSIFALQPDGTLKPVASGANKTQVLSQGQILYKQNADGSYTQVAAGAPKAATATGGAAGKPIVSNGKTVTQDQLAAVRDGFNAVRGTDTYMDPYTYLQEYNTWTSTLGLNATDFVKQFPPKDYLNPSSRDIQQNGQSLLPANLLPPKAATTTGRGH